MRTTGCFVCARQELHFHCLTPRSQHHSGVPRVPRTCRYRVRPSALLSVLQAAGVAAGAAAALAPPATRDAAIAALQESLTDLNNDNLRLLREAGLSDQVGRSTTMH